MEIKNGVIIDGVLHEGIVMRNAHCDGCSLIAICHEIHGDDALCAIIDCDKFVNLGKATVIFYRETPESTGDIYRNGVKIERER